MGLLPILLHVVVEQVNEYLLDFEVGEGFFGEARPVFMRLEANEITFELQGQKPWFDLFSVDFLGMAGGAARLVNAVPFLVLRQKILAVLDLVLFGYAVFGLFGEGAGRKEQTEEEGEGQTLHGLNIASNSVDAKLGAKVVNSRFQRLILILESLSKNSFCFPMSSVAS